MGDFADPGNSLATKTRSRIEQYSSKAACKKYNVHMEASVWRAPALFIKFSRSLAPSGGPARAVGAKFRESFTLLTKMIENLVPEEHQSFRDLQKVPSGLPASNFGAQRASHW